MISNLRIKRKRWINRKRRLRKRIVGTPERPRLSVFRSSRHIYAQVIDDDSGQVLAAASTLEKEMRVAVKGLKKTEAAEKIGIALAERCLKKEIQKVVFDRNGFSFHGRVAKVADAAREKGLKF